VKNEKEKRHKKKALRGVVRQERLIFPDPNDNWFPVFPDGSIKIYRVEWPDKTSAVGIYGLDEKSKVRYFKSEDRKEGIEIFKSIPDKVVSIKWAKQNGFEND